MKPKERSSLKKGSTPAEKRAIDRRKEAGKGFTYISTVGWICRREKTRRKDDPFIF